MAAYSTKEVGRSVKPLASVSLGSLPRAATNINNAKRRILMAGNRQGGLKTAQAVYAQYGENYYRMIGYIGGKAKPTKPRGFAANRELASIAGKKGGSVSRRRKVAAGA